MDMFKEIAAVLVLRARIFTVEPWFSVQERIMFFSGLIGLLSVLGFVTWNALLPFCHGLLLFSLRLLLPSDTLKAAYLDGTDQSESVDGGGGQS